MEFFTWKKGELVQFTPHFNSKEFECKCENTDCIDQKISKELIEKLEKCRLEFKQSVIITSGYRCSKHNKSIGGAPKSQHVLGNAVDSRPKTLTTDTMDEWTKIIASTFKAIGIAQSFVHADVRKVEGKARKIWHY
jgi:uncharacterized protein YcbK (DUF882 family)